MFDQHFLGSGLSIFLPELFALDSKSYHDSAHQCCPAQDPKGSPSASPVIFGWETSSLNFASWQSILQA